MKMKLMKIISLLIHVAILSAMLSLFTACGIIIINDKGRDERIKIRETAAESDETAVSETGPALTAAETARPYKPVVIPDNKKIARKYLNAVETRDFNGVGILIATTDVPTFAPQDTSNLVYNARIERNIAVEEKFNTKIIAVPTEYRELYDNTYNAVYAGEYYTDILGLPSVGIGQFYAKGLIMNLNSLPFADYTAPYFDAKAMSQLSAGYGVYGAVGELNKNIDYYFGVFFNKKLIKELGLESPYDLVYENKWTLDKFREMTRAVSAVYGVYGHGHGAKITPDNYIDMFYLASGENFMDTGVNIYPSPEYLNTRAENLVTKLRRILKTDGTLFDGKSEDALKTFYDGKLLFYVDLVNVMQWFTDMDDDWGLAPLPKLDVSQSYYYTYPLNSIPVISVPLTTSNIENIGLFLQAANAASYGYINDVYYSILQRDIVRDSDTLNMLDYITGINGKGRLAVDFALTLGNGYSFVVDGTYNAVRLAVNQNYSLKSLFDNYSATLASRLKQYFPMDIG